MSLSDTYETNVLNYLFTASAATRPTAWYVGLQTSSNTDDTPGAEISGGAYARQSVALSVTGNLATNSGVLAWPTATSEWGDITSVAVYDAATSGNQIAHADLTVVKNVGVGDNFRIMSGQLDITLE